MKSAEDEDWKNPEGFLCYKREEFVKAINSIVVYSMMTPPFEAMEYKEFTREFWSTPSLKTIKKIIKYHMYFESKNKYTWQSDGTRNVWVVKPANNSRGSGIFLHTDSFDIINSSEGYSRVVQKYVETPLICNNPSYELLYRKKFDIRQWVLVTGYNPLKAYVFSSCYLRICSESYCLNDLKSLQKHLTNFSFNKNNFAKKQESIESLENFKVLLGKEYNVDWDQQIKPKIHEIINNTLICCSDGITDAGNRFEMYGFDILIDEDFRPWLLEANLSPACEERTDFLKEYCEVMGEQLLRLVLPEEYFPEKHLNTNYDKYQWERLSASCEERRRELELEVTGVRTSIKYERQLDRSYE